MHVSDLYVPNARKTRFDIVVDITRSLKIQKTVTRSNIKRRTNNVKGQNEKQ